MTFTVSGDQNLDTVGSHYAVYHANVKGSGGMGDEHGNVVVGGSKSVGQLHGISTSCDGGGDVDIGKGTSNVS